MENRSSLRGLLYLKQWKRPEANPSIYIYMYSMQISFVPFKLQMTSCKVKANIKKHDRRKFIIQLTVENV